MPIPARGLAAALAISLLLVGAQAGEAKPIALMRAEPTLVEAAGGMWGDVEDAPLPCGLRANPAAMALATRLNESGARQVAFEVAIAAGACAPAIEERCRGWIADGIARGSCASGAQFVLYHHEREGDIPRAISAWIYLELSGSLPATGLAYEMRGPFSGVGVRMAS